MAPAPVGEKKEADLTAEDMSLQKVKAKDPIPAEDLPGTAITPTYPELFPWAFTMMKAGNVT